MTGPGEEPDTPAERSVANNALFSLLTLMVTSGLTAALTLVLVRVLNPEGYGTFALAVSIGAMLFLLADLGITNATTRFIAEQRHSADEVRGLFLDGLRLKVIAASVVCGALGLLAGPIATAYDQPSLAWPLRLVAVAVFAQALLALLGSTATTLRRSDVNLRIVASQSLLEFSASLALVLAGGGVVGAAAGRAIGYGAGALIALVLILRLLGRSATPRPRGTLRPFARRIAGYAGALLLIDGALAAFSQIEVLLVGGFLGAAAAGTFQAPLRLLTFLHYPGYAVATAVAPRYSRPESGSFDTTLLHNGLRVVILLQIALTVPTIVWARPIVDLLLGAGYGDSAAVLAAFGPLTFLQGLGPIVSMTVNYAGEARRRLPIAFVALAVNAALGVVLIPAVGVVGGAISVDVAYAIYVAAHLWVCRRVLGLPLMPVLSIFLRGIVAGAAMAGVLLAFGTDDLGVADWLAGGTLALASYAVLLVVTGAVTRGEIAVMRAAAVARWAARAR